MRQMPTSADMSSYDVEKIMGHEFMKDVRCRLIPWQCDRLTGNQGALYFIVKWKGWDKPEDQTMEPEENL